MRFLCTMACSGAVTTGDFLGKGASANGKADYQGCSEFNPVMMFSASENAALQSNTTERNKQNSVNRRILVLLFRAGTPNPGAKWPCPEWTEGTGGCTKRFFADAAKRRQFQGHRRTVEADKDTFACRFYERLVNHSPCEGPNPTPIILEKVNPIILVGPGEAPGAPPAKPSATPHNSRRRPTGSKPPPASLCRATLPSTPAPLRRPTSASSRRVAVDVRHRPNRC